MNHNDECQNCTFYSHWGDGHGLCKRYAPMPMLLKDKRSELDPSDYSFFAYWPLVPANDGCGEFQQAQPQE